MLNLRSILPKAFLFLVIIISLSFLLEFQPGYFLFTPLLAPVLILYIFSRFKNLEHHLIPLLLVAVFFSFLGNILFMVAFEPAIFKLLGICTYIIAQICYEILYYLSTRKSPTKNENHFQRWPELVCALILAATIIYIYPFFGDFKIPGMIYAFVGSLTILLALNRRFHVSYSSFRNVFIGVSCFFVSDLLTGLDLYLTNVYLNAAIILFYSFGHWMVTQGMSIQFEEEINNDNKFFNNQPFKV